VLDVDREMRFAMRAGIPMKMAQPEGELENKGGDFPHYIGQRDTARGCKVICVEADGARRELRLRLDLARHSPTGFEWGYEGSGPSQLALALLADCLGDDRPALEHYQEFKRLVIAPMQQRRWRLTSLEVRAVVDRIREGERA
jgi:hypothetical protein